MKLHTTSGLAGLLLAAVLLVASCGGAGEGGAGEGGAAQGDPPDRAKKNVPDGGYSDKRFIDKMVVHHRGAIDMAEVALKNAEHRQVKELSESIVSTQGTEIRALEDIKREEFGTSKVNSETGMGQMEDMGMMMDPASLADKEPFDKSFIGAMIPHHRAAVEMAEAAQRRSGNPRIKELAGEIVGAQEREISRMRSWRDAWYPEG